MVDALAEELQRRRLAIVGEVDQTEGDLKSITQEREPEMEEDAQKERIATILERLNDRERAELEEIDVALQRIVRGTYGKCESCGNPIALERLQALPTTRLCIQCARAREGLETGEAEEEASESPMPPDLSMLDNDELEAALYEIVRNAGTIDMEELEISARDGVIYLEGAIPSEKQHQILTQLLQDVGGIQDLVDHLEIRRIAWERTDRSRAESAEEQPPSEETETEDVVRSIQEGTPYSPPLSPIPDEEQE